MAVVAGRRHASRLRWYLGSSRGWVARRLRRAGRPGCWVLFAGPELDAAHRPQLRALLDRTRSSGTRVMVLDLRETEFLSIRVAASLAEIKADAWRHGIELRLVTGGAAAERALELVGVRQLFRYYTCVDDAVRPPID
ncbi:STAS domain-containing protein [Nocardia canadensis]|uniref:STAS domain-containing protein n=1 Tax=Nocardia canadensis TaxID=3065238 RepID=UPI00292DC9D8|nr:STAS domain-containing protein [Nocardia canadensis]